MTRSRLHLLLRRLRVRPRTLLVVAPILLAVVGGLAAGAVISDVREDARREGDAATVAAVYGAQLRLVAVLFDGLLSRPSPDQVAEPRRDFIVSAALQRVIANESRQFNELKRLVGGTPEGAEVVEDVAVARGDALGLVRPPVYQEEIERASVSVNRAATGLDRLIAAAQARQRSAEARARTVTIAVIVIAVVTIAAGSWLLLAITRRLQRTHVRALRRQAEQDPLTGLGNRRALEAAAAELEGVDAVLAVCDLDGFKPFNDRFGHPAGDELLQRLADRLQEVAADTGGRAYRVGGDEFCVLAAGASPTGLRERCRAALHEQTADYAIGASVGIAALPREATELDGAWRVADARLYEAKRARYLADPEADRRSAAGHAEAG